MTIRGLVSMAVVILVWGITFVNTRALLVDFSSLEIQLLRFGIAWVALWMAGMISKRSAILHSSSFLLRSRKDEVLFALMGLCGVVIYQFLENCAIYYTNASNVAILMAFGPVVTAVMVRMFCHEHRPTICKMWVGTMIAIAGVAVISFNNAVVFELRPIGDLMAMAAMISWGIYSMLIDKVNKAGYPQTTIIRKTFGWALVFMVPLAIWGLTDSGYTAMDGSFSVTLDAGVNCERFSNLANWLNLGFLGLFASALCFVLWNVACLHLGVVRTTIGLYLTPVVGVIFAAVFLDERLTMMTAAGGLLIIVGVAIANSRRAK